jgi:hypothetical protein
MAQQINLYQAKFRKARKPLSAWEASLGLLLIAASVFSYSGFLWQRDTQLATVAQAVDRDVAEKKVIVDKLSQEITTRRKDAQLDSAAQRAEQQVTATREVMHLINGGAIGVPTGYSEPMRALARQALNGLWLTGFTLAANADENVIRGRTLDPELVPAYLRRLNGESSLQGQHFDTLTISTPEAAPLVPGAPAQPAAASPATIKPAALKFLEFSVGAAQAAAPGKAGAK